MNRLNAGSSDERHLKRLCFFLNLCYSDLICTSLCTVSAYCSHILVKPSDTEEDPRFKSASVLMRS